MTECLTFVVPQSFLVQFQMEPNEEQKLLLDTYDVILGLDEMQCLTLFDALDTVEKWCVLEED